MDKVYSIAGLLVSLNTFGKTEKHAIRYLSCVDQKADIAVRSNIGAVKCENPHVSDDVAEYLSSGANFYFQLLRYNGLMMHSSAVVMDGKAYLFSANSGTGKSTHTSLWLKAFGDKAYILNDDKPALRLIDGTWYAFGTPWSGKYDISVNTGVPIGGICMLERGDDNEITPFRGKNAIFEIFSQTNRPKSAEYRGKLLELLDNLITRVPIWKLRCNMDIEAAYVAYNAMSKGLQK